MSLLSNEKQTNTRLNGKPLPRAVPLAVISRSEFHNFISQVASEISRPHRKVAIPSFGWWTAPKHLGGKLQQQNAGQHFELIWLYSVA